MKNNNLLKYVNSPRIFLGSILFIVGSIVVTTTAYSTDEAVIQNRYLQNMQQCERQLALAQCQRTENLKYKTEQHTLKQQKLIQTQAIRTLKIQQKTIRPRLSQQYKPSKEINKRPLLQSSLPTSKAIILTRPPLITAKKHTYTQAKSLLIKPPLIAAKKYRYRPTNSPLVKPIKVKPAINFTKRKVDSNQKRTRRLAKNNKRREQGFVVDTVIVL